MGSIERQRTCRVCGEKVPPTHRVYCSDKHRRWWENRSQHPPAGTRRRELVIWAAGFIDGEGSVGFITRREADRRAEPFTFCLSATNRNVPALRRLQDLFGGSLNQARQTKEKWATCHMWRASGANAAGALKQMQPYLVVKSEQARVALEFAELRKASSRSPLTPEERQRREALFAEMRELNRRGSRHTDEEGERPP